MFVARCLTVQEEHTPYYIGEKQEGTGVGRHRLAVRSELGRAHTNGYNESQYREEGNFGWWCLGGEH